VGSIASDGYRRAEPRFTFLLWKSSGAFRFTVSGFHGGGGAAARIGRDRGGLPPDSSLLSSILMPGALEPSRGLPEGMTPIRVNLVPGVCCTLVANEMRSDRVVIGWTFGQLTDVFLFAETIDGVLISWFEVYFCYCNMDGLCMCKMMS